MSKISKFNLSNLGLENGTYSITVVAKASGYKDSEPSDAVPYVVEGELPDTPDTPDTYTLSGTWVFNDEPEIPSASIEQIISFTSNSVLYDIMYALVSFGGSIRYGYLFDTAYDPTNGWSDTAYKTVDFGSTPQVVSEEFYNWFTANAQLQGEQPDEPETPEEPTTQELKIINTKTSQEYKYYSSEQTLGDFILNETENSKEFSFGSDGGVNYRLWFLWLNTSLTSKASADTPTDSTLYYTARDDYEIPQGNYTISSYDEESGLGTNKYGVIFTCDGVEYVGMSRTTYAPLARDGYFELFYMKRNNGEEESVKVYKNGWINEKYKYIEVKETQRATDLIHKIITG